MKCEACKVKECETRDLIKRKYMEKTADNLFLINSIDRNCNEYEV